MKRVSMVLRASSKVMVGIWLVLGPAYWKVVESSYSSCYKECIKNQVQYCTGEYVVLNYRFIRIEVPDASVMRACRNIVRHGCMWVEDPGANPICITISEERFPGDRAKVVVK